MEGSILRTTLARLEKCASSLYRIDSKHIALERFDSNKGRIGANKLP
jgi:hypothetical protein